MNRPATGAPPQQVARDEAAEVGRTTVDAGREVAGTAADQARSVADEAVGQARDLLGEARGQLTEQARSGQRTAVDGMRSLAEELRSMADRGRHDGPASEVARQAADRTHRAADWLEGREPGDLVDEVRGLARRHPGAFLLGAAAAGVLAGRLTRGAVDVHRDGDGARPTDDHGGYPVPPPAAAPWQERAAPVPPDRAAYDGPAGAPPPAAPAPPPPGPAPHPYPAAGQPPPAAPGGYPPPPPYQAPPPAPEGAPARPSSVGEYVQELERGAAVRPEDDPWRPEHGGPR